MSCPICNKDSAPRYRPFCSKRCADIDLGKWFDGSYSVPVEEGPDDVFDAEDTNASGRQGRKPH
ncbi:DNA gyrase inhibitor YacG [Shimia biformata]|uniref:DNA gyrase inhibitor YacG n=1 Tax=Shimia biformata TaxID=1294299 RepID=UPI00194E8E57|nr:DNA gyrase inhibitor YacG [Shimia biformata]